MAKRVRKLPMAIVSGEPTFAIRRNDWPKIERAYGHKLPEPTRDEIVKLTTSFVLFAPFEMTAEPLKSARDIANTWKRAAANLRRAMHEHGSQTAVIFAKHRVEMHFIDASFGTLSGVLTSFIVACDRATADMDDPALPGHRQGECWERWVCGLTQALDKDCLPTGARKDSADLGAESPFTNLVATLQKFVPAEFRRATASPTALAKAIQRARTNRARDK